MHNELEALDQLKLQNQTRIIELEKMVQARDREISRLGNLYIGGEKISALNLEFVSNENSKTILKLEQ